MLKKISVAAFIISAITSCSGNEKKEVPVVQNTNTTEVKSDNIKTENVDYTGDGVTMKGFVAYDQSMNSLRPVVLIVPEWWGISDYTRNRAKQLAAMGYIAFAIDMYGEGKTAETPEEAQKLSAPFYGTMKLATPRFEAALAKIKSYSNADTSKIAAIGYCFGGAMVLNMAKTGEPLKGVVSFHGNLAGAPAIKNLLKSEILVCHGEEDKFVSPAEVSSFKKQMDSIGAVYTFKSYPGATHAFTNPEATAKGIKYNIPVAYNAAADTASFNEMKIFLNKIFR